MKKSFLELIQGRVYLDGGMGSALVKRGISTLHAEVNNVENPDLIYSVHEDYFKAGSDVVYTNTFSCNRKKADLTKYTLAQLINGGVKIAREVADNYGGYALYDCGPIGELMYPYGRLTFDEAYEIFSEQAKIIKDLPLDGVVIETISDLQEMRSAILAFRENTDFPIICSMTFEESGRTFSGTSAESFALCSQALGANAIGVNCGTGANGMKNALSQILAVSKVPVFAKPNAGLPRYENGKTVYDLTADEFSEQVKTLAEMGVSMLGGCCGTDSEYIYKMKNATKYVPVIERKVDCDGVCSYSKTVRFTHPLIIGERVNPTNKPLLKQAIIDDDYDYILSMCVNQTENGADMLDVNLGMTGIDEKEKLVKAITYVQGVADVPLVIDTPKKDALESAVRITNGVCVINSVSGELSSMEKVFPIAKKYGSYVVALCLDEKGIPSSVDGRIEIAKKILSKSAEYGIGKEKLIFDPLTMAISVDVNNGLKVLDTIRRLREELGVKTVLGLSNISFGLPNRAILNGAFKEMVKSEGVSAIIIDPSIKGNFDRVAIDALSGKDFACATYIAQNSVVQEKEQVSLGRDMKYCILRGLIDDGLRTVKASVNENNYEEFLQNEIIEGLNELGVRYEKGLAFLPQLIAGSEVAKVALDYIKSTYIKESGRAKATIILATVKGDVHDIGKNIVKAVTANYGYKIIDLGKDVPKEEILSAIEKYYPDAVGLSALMTTTVDNMTETVRAIKKRYFNMPILVGGAVVTEKYAEEIGAIYSKDAQNNVKILEKLFINR